MAKTTRVCRYTFCSAESKTIDLETEEYVEEDKKFYHKSCYEQMIKEREAKKIVEADCRLIEDLWVKHISNTVNYGYLRKILNEYLERGVSSDYLVFAMQYVVSHKLSLRHPAGLRYIVDKIEIREAWKKQQAEKLAKQQKDFKPKRKSEPPQFVTQRQNKTGFGAIIEKE